MARTNGPNPLFLAPGILFVSLGLVVWFNPDFLRFLVAAGLCGIGSLLLLAAFRPPGPPGGIHIRGLGDLRGPRGPFGPS
ncbi:MAG: hypothetical protein AAF196_20560 [Planctomycetota bacterium]